MTDPRDAAVAALRRLTASSFRSLGRLCVGVAEMEAAHAALAAVDAAPSVQPVAQDSQRDAHFGGDSYEASMLRDLLAVIHRDGGHYVAEHGLDKAIDDARAAVLSRMNALDLLVTAKRAKDDGDEARHAFLKPLAWAAALAVADPLYAAPAQQAVPRRARKIGGSFQHTGHVVAQFKTLAGEPRIVLEFDAPVSGMLHVYRPDQIEDAPAPEQAAPTVQGTGQG